MASLREVDLLSEGILNYGYMCTVHKYTKSNRINKIVSATRFCCNVHLKLMFVFVFLSSSDSYLNIKTNVLYRYTFNGEGEQL